MLASDHQAAGRISGALQEAEQIFQSDCAYGDVGSMVGSYLLIRQIGSGGMGTVYQAIRSDGEFLQTVAVKLVHRGMDTRSILLRFRTERQILANLTHPNITMLLDGGLQVMAAHIWSWNTSKGNCCWTGARKIDSMSVGGSSSFGRYVTLFSLLMNIR